MTKKQTTALRKILDCNTDSKLKKIFVPEDDFGQWYVGNPCCVIKFTPEFDDMKELIVDYGVDTSPNCIFTSVFNKLDIYDYITGNNATLDDIKEYRKKWFDNRKVLDSNELRYRIMSHTDDMVSDLWANIDLYQAMLEAIPQSTFVWSGQIDYLSYQQAYCPKGYYVFSNNEPDNNLMVGLLCPMKTKK